MQNEKQLQAKNLYFQTDLTKTEIAELIGVPRRTLHYWIRENNWARLKASATHLPAMLAENCYMIFNKFATGMLTEDRIQRPVTRHEAEIMYKLTLTIRRLKNHSTLNESMELFARFMERIDKRSPELADQVAPFVQEYVEDWSRLNVAAFRPEKMNDLGLLPFPPEDPRANKEDHEMALHEIKQDMDDIFAWDTGAGSPKEKGPDSIPSATSAQDTPTAHAA